MLSCVKTCALAGAMVEVATLPGSDAHGALGVPKIKFIDSAKDKTNYWAYGIAAETNPPVSAYSHLLSEADRQKGFEKNFVANGFKSLREYIEKYQKVVPYDGRPAGGTPECGFTDPNGPPQPIPDQIAWRGPTFQHSGPCEAWCDDERVMYAPSCKVWETTGGKMTYDKAKCIGKKRLTFYWLATFNVPFQVYTDCAPLQGATAGNSTTVAPTPAKTPAPKPATKTPTEKTPTAVAAEATSKPSSCKRRAKKQTNAKVSRAKQPVACAFFQLSYAKSLFVVNNILMTLAPGLLTTYCSVVAILYITNAFSRAETVRTPQGLSR